MKKGNGAEELVIHEANMDTAMRRYYRRAGAERVYDTMPFDAMLARENDGIDGGDEGPGEYEMHQRVVGIRAFLRFIKSRGLELPTILKMLYAAGRAVHDDFFSGLTMEESALLFSETKAAHSWRCKLISGQLKLNGMKGIQLPGQKSPESSESYRKAAKGNQNRRRSRRRKEHKADDARAARALRKGLSIPIP